MLDAGIDNPACEKSDWSNLTSMYSIMISYQGKKLCSSLKRIIFNILLRIRPEFSLKALKTNCSEFKRLIPFQPDIALLEEIAYLCWTSHKQFPTIEHQNCKYQLSLSTDLELHILAPDILCTCETRTWNCLAMAPQTIWSNMQKEILFSYGSNPYRQSLILSLFNKHTTYFGRLHSSLSQFNFCILNCSIKS